jgi:hypothetical protein
MSAGSCELASGSFCMTPASICRAAHTMP